MRKLDMNEVYKRSSDPCTDCADTRALAAEMLTHNRGRRLTYECGWCGSTLTADYWPPDKASDA